LFDSSIVRQSRTRSTTELAAANQTFECLSAPRTAGQYRSWFCFDNGLVTGDGVNIRFVNRGDIKKSYNFRDGQFEFGD
jgi:hypothetical protein